MLEAVSGASVRLRGHQSAWIYGAVTGLNEMVGVTPIHKA